MRDHVEFLRQFRDRFKTTGAVAPSSRFLAAAMTRPFAERSRPARVLEIGPGTGAVTRHIVNQMGPQDRLDLVELNETFAANLARKLEEEPGFRAVAERTNLHQCRLEDFRDDAPYEFIISGLPLNNFAADSVSDIFDTYFRLLAPGGVLSYFEYMYVRPLRRLVARGPERHRLTQLDQVMQPYVSKRRFRRNWVFANVPPAWVQHLKQSEATDNQPIIATELIDRGPAA